MSIDFSVDELKVLQQLAKARIDQLGPEIHHTRTMDYREELEELREQLRGIHDRLGLAVGV